MLCIDSFVIMGKSELGGAVAIRTHNVQNRWHFNLSVTVYRDSRFTITVFFVLKLNKDE